MADIGNTGSYLWGGYDHTSSIREDLVNWIANISPHETPVVNSIGTTKARGTLHEWQLDTLRARVARGKVEGRDWSSAAASATAPSRPNNHTEIFGDDLGISKTMLAVDTAGFADAYAYELEKKTKATMIDIEVALMAAGTSATGASGIARVMKSLEDFITTTVYTSVDYNGHATGTGTPASAIHAGIFNAQDVNAILNDIWDQGGNTDLIVMSGAYKRQFSAFSGGSGDVTGANVRNILATDKKLVVGIDVYDSDFGLVPVQLNRWSPVSTNTGTASASATATSAPTPSDVSGRIWFLQRSMLRLAWLRPLKHELMGTRGDSIVGMLTGELTLEVGNEASCGVFKGVNNKSAVT